MSDRILVVDDNRDAADALAKLVESFGFTTKVCYDGTEAIELTSGFQPDMVLLDIGMPGLNGYETVEEIRRRRGDVHLIVVAVTAWAAMKDKQKAYASGFDLHVAKPMSVETLKELLELLDPEHGITQPSLALDEQQSDVG